MSPVVTLSLSLSLRHSHPRSVVRFHCSTVTLSPSSLAFKRTIVLTCLEDEVSGKLHLRLQYKYMKDWEVVYRSLEAVKEEKWDHALELLNAALEVTSNQQRLYQARSETLLRLHRIQEAMKDAQKMIEINPNTAMVRPPLCPFPPSSLLSTFPMSLLPPLYTPPPLPLSLSPLGHSRSPFRAGALSDWKGL